MALRARVVKSRTELGRHRQTCCVAVFKRSKPIDWRPGGVPVATALQRAMTLHEADLERLDERSTLEEYYEDFSQSTSAIIEANAAAVGWRPPRDPIADFYGTAFLVGVNALATDQTAVLLAWSSLLRHDVPMEPACEASIRQRDLASAALDYVRKALAFFASPDCYRLADIDGVVPASMHMLAEMQLERTKGLQFLDATGVWFEDDKVTRRSSSAACASTPRPTPSTVPSSASTPSPARRSSTCSCARSCAR